MLLLFTFSREEGSSTIVRKLEQLDAALIVTELIILGAYFNFAFFLPTGARESAAILFETPMFVIGFLGFGLIIPLLIETYSIFFARHTRGSASLMVTAGCLVLAGGFLLRYYVLHAGVFQYPW